MARRISSVLLLPVGSGQRAALPFACPLGLFPFELGEIFPDQRIEVGIDPEAGVRDARNFRPEGILARHRAQAAGGGAARKQEQQSGEQYSDDRGSASSSRCLDL